MAAPNADIPPSRTQLPDMSGTHQWNTAHSHDDSQDAAAYLPCGAMSVCSFHFQELKQEPKLRLLQFDQLQHKPMAGRDKKEEDRGSNA
jgi:hypothetical protein